MDTDTNIWFLIFSIELAVNEVIILKGLCIDLIFKVELIIKQLILHIFFLTNNSNRLIMIYMYKALFSAMLNQKISQMIYIRWWFLME